MAKIDYQKRWVGQDLNDDAVRKRFIRHLKRWHNEFTTPYWQDKLTDWLIYDCTIRPCGVHVESIDESVVTLCAHAAGVQTEGICLDAIFKIPTEDFLPTELMMMIGPHRYDSHGPVCRFTWFPDAHDIRMSTGYITELSWWYDENHDDSRKR